jgi:hypothetical protein
LGKFGTAIPDNGQKHPLISSGIISENILSLLNRQNDQGDIQTMAEQDRSQWDKV